MAKIISTTFGAVIALFGLVGFVSPSLGGTLGTPLCNFIHLLAGAALVAAALKAGPSVLFWSIGSGGACYLLAGLAGVICGRPGTPGVAGFPPNERLVVLIPKFLELGSADHVLHLFFGIALLTAAAVSVAESPFRLRK